MKNQTTPRIYVACLASYNDGKLHGKWIDCDQDSYDIEKEIDEMLEKSPIEGAEEWAIHDYEGFGGLKLDETEDLETIVKIAELIEEYGELFCELVSYFGINYLDTAIEHMEEHYQGEFQSLEVWAYQMLENTGDLNKVPEHLRMYFDYEKYGSDCELNGDILTIQVCYGKVHVFWSC